MNLLITGGSGFVGSNLAIRFKKLYPSWTVLALDNLKRRGSELNVPRLRNNGVQFIHGDIRNSEDFDTIGDVDCIIDAAAEPSVTAGLESNTDYVVNTNLMGTINCLNFAVKRKAMFIFLSSSRIYPFDLLDQVKFEEKETRFEIIEDQVLPGISNKGVTLDFPLRGPKSLYGATKLSSELLMTEYNEFLNLKSVVNRCGVITGPWQMGKVDQGVIVLWLARHFWKKNLSYNGYGGLGKQVRDILHINDLFRLVDWQIHNIDKINGRVYNVGGGYQCSVSLLELTRICEEITGNKIIISPSPENRKADVRIYITDNSLVTDQTGWSPNYTPDEILQEIFEWIEENQNQLEPILN